MVKMKLGVLCSGNLGFSVLKSLAENYEVEFVLTDSKSIDIISYCDNHQIDSFKGNPRNGATAAFLKQKTANVLISVNYLFVIEEDIIGFAKDLIFNIHGSLLPKYRGRTPHVWAIINNEVETGITAHLIDEGCDTGAILEQVRIPISDSDTGADVLSKFEIEYYALIEKLLNNFKNNTLTLKKQDDEKATYFGKRTPEDGEINWNWQKERIYNWVRAQSKPYPGAFTLIGEQKVTIDKIAFSDKGYNFDMPNGLIIAHSPAILVKTANGVIELEQIRENQHLCKKDIIFNKKTS